ncbi:MAG: hypothetical protein IBX55_01150 [Methyloprofundus sp.]|nr:hypothetical protein [Methyloprofundus sp.]
MFIDGADNCKVYIERQNFYLFLNTEQFERYSNMAVASQIDDKEIGFSRHVKHERGIGMSNGKQDKQESPLSLIGIFKRALSNTGFASGNNALTLDNNVTTPVVDASKAEVNILHGYKVHEILPIDPHNKRS